ncbi:SOS response-associated peptidase [Pseudophaeobacter arcticus]|uniref:SOS response-associated peptidase n=1 Tax=Pseudophaeobacter arcticus TaxID=385492 RepID=UPI00040D69B6|nr:SOS response-associated peptidase [Pseudophaeobacter arcticus]
MCGRFALTLPNDAMAHLFAASPANDLPVLPNYNICPTNPVHVIKAEGGGRQLVAMRWGFLPQWYQSETAGPLLINARAETLAQKPAFAEACRARRCLIPATGFYEWVKGSDGNRLPWYIHATEPAPLAFAGIWQSWGGEAQKTCAIVTTAANQTISAIHHRMPLVLEPHHWPLWLGEAGKGAAALMQPGREGQLQMHRVAPQVNSNRAAGPELIEPFFEDPSHADAGADAAQTQDSASPAKTIRAPEPRLI